MIKELKKQLATIRSYMAFVERKYMHENEKPYDNWEYGKCCGAIDAMEATLKEAEEASNGQDIQER